MAKKCMIAREVKRTKAASRGAKARAALKALIRSEDTDFDKKQEAVMALNKRRRDESKTRQTKRCVVCGRPHAVYSKFKLCRICLRNSVMKGWLPGVSKSSW